MASPALHPTTAPLVIPPPPPVPGSRPGSSAGPLSPASPGERRGSQGYLAGQPTASSVGSPPTSPVPTNRRASYQPGKSAIPPVPGAFPAPPTPQARPPPPPPPTGAPPAQPPPTAQEDSTEEEVTEYEADYDTDMANKVGHRDALTAHSRSITEDDDTPLPSPPAAPHRSVPPPPPPVPGTSNSRPGSARQSLDMPRAAPPMPPPPPPAPVQEQSSDDDDEVGDEYDPYRYGSASHPPPATSAHPPPSSYDDPRPMTGSGRPKMSMDLPRPPPSRGTLDATSRAGRRSMDTARPFTDHIAHELDLTSLNPWWTLPTPLPPILGPRAKDLILEAEESTSTKRGGRVQVQKDIYILFHDYSQSIITARYDASNPTASSAVSFEQRHEPPPPQPRQDQLEDFSIRFGAAVHTFASSAAGKTIGDGDPHSLVSAAISSVPNVLSPVGHRAYGALVYANLANASVQQWDEIRRGDVVTFRNARFVGHKGGLHSKYTLEVREHVGVVEEWDGTKKKVKIWEQGRLEGDGGHGEKGAKKKGVREEAYRMGDLRSGEVKVWRVVGRAWVGWE